MHHLWKTIALLALLACNSSSKKPVIISQNQGDTNKQKDELAQYDFSASEDNLVADATAPELNTQFGWVNTNGKEYKLSDFKGKIVLLEFWTYGCVNCHLIINDLKRLEKEYAKEIVTIGVHSAKFNGERKSDLILKAALKLGIDHPVVNDADFSIWNAYGVHAWPTVVLIDPDQKIVTERVGEGVYEPFRTAIEEQIALHGDKLNTQPFQFNPPTLQVDGPLRFPSKVIAGADGTYWMSNSGNHEVLQLDAQGQVITRIGNGSGFTDGSFSQAQLHEPHGLALAGDLLYIADTRNHAIRIVNLRTKTLSTAVGDGSISRYYKDEKRGEPVSPTSPWDLALGDGYLYIASAGNHQILRMELKSNKAYRYAGTGTEMLTDGPIAQAEFSQPSGLAYQKGTLYVADTEGSSVRAIDTRQGTVRTLIGKGLFDFGDVDGPANQARLEHVTGLDVHDSKLYIADTYNGKVKVLNLNTMRVTTLVAGLEEPSDVAWINNHLLITNTNQHTLLQANPSTGAKTVLSGANAEIKNGRAS